MIQFLLLVSLSLPLVTGFGFTQSVKVTGTLRCHKKPASEVKVKLYDDDGGPDLDDLMDTGYTDANGFFTLEGHASEIFKIDPKINIYHDCDDGMKPCQRRLTMYIPNDYISYGKTPESVFNAGIIELSGEISGESRDCINK